MIKLNKQKNPLGLENRLNDASLFIKEEFGLEISESQLKHYSKEQWKEFCNANGFEKKCDGVYIPKSLIAYVNESSKFIVSDSFHEYFGHGLFCEHSIIGQELVKSEQKGEDSYKYLFDINTIITSGLTRRNIDNYEGFATWMEALLCKETGNNKIWEMKKEKLPRERIDLLEYFRLYEHAMTKYGLMAQMGFPKRYEPSKIVNVVKALYGKHFKEIESIIAYGSKKPYSDIDLFIVSKEASGEFFNGWLDIYQTNKGNFEKGIKLLDISMTDPLFSGELIYGSKDEFNRLKKEILCKPISQESVTHNSQCADNQRKYIKNELNERDRKRAETYSKSYESNARALSNGVKPLTYSMLKNLL